MTTNRRVSMFEDQRATLDGALMETAASLLTYGERYRHWAIAYSGGKDSSATVTAIVHLLETGRVPRPESLTVLYADTRMELPPLQIAAMETLRVLRERGVSTQVVLPALDDRYFVYMLGRGVPPPKNRFRWCTPQLKIEPMAAALADLRARAGEKLLMLTGVRVGESASRDQTIAISCGRDGAECGQGWFQSATPAAVADTLAPLLHWRVCHVWDWLTFEAPRLGFATATIAEVYGGEEARERDTRTGCVGCNLATNDRALDYAVALPEWSYLAPFKRLRPLYKELTRPVHRIRKDGSERRRNGWLVSNPMRMGPLTMEARRKGLEEVLAVQDEINVVAEQQGRPLVSLIDHEELRRIEELMAANTWPRGWDGTEARADVMLPQVFGEGLVQPLMFTLEERS